MSNPFFIPLHPAWITNALSYDLTIHLVESITSTMNYFKTTSSLNAPQCCLAEQQTHGRGRLNNAWHSPFGENIYLSYYIPLKKNISDLSGFSLVMGLAVVAALKQLDRSEGVVIKWPNDLWYGNKKIGGVLIDVDPISKGGCSVTIGVGLNVNMLSDAPMEPISQSWTSLREITGHLLDRNPIVLAVLENLFQYYSRFEQEGFAVFMAEWMAVDALYQKVVTFRHGNRLLSGVVMGITSAGYLRLGLSDGQIQVFSSGDIMSIRPA